MLRLVGLIAFLLWLEPLAVAQLIEEPVEAVVAPAFAVPVVSPVAPETAVPPLVPAAIEQIEVNGRLLEKGTKKPLADVNVYAFSPPENPQPIKTVTGADGKFVLKLPVGPARFKVAVANYANFERIENIAQTQSPRRFYLEKKSYLVYETTVFGQEDKRDDKTQSLTQDQFMTLPGANGDPVKAVQNLPGVNRANAFSSQIIIEGSSPADTRYNIDTQPVPIIFHFGGLDSVVMPEAIERVDYLSAGFGPEYGQSTAGMVNLNTRDPQTDRAHGMAFVDIFHAGALYETQINGHSNFLVGARKSYIGEVLGRATRGNSKVDLTVAPDFDDAVIMYNNKLNARDSFKLLAIGSIDTLAFLQKEPSSAGATTRGNFSDNVSFYRILPEYTHKIDADTTGRVWLGLGQDSSALNIGSIYQNSHSSVISGRAEVEEQVSKSWKTYVGFDNTLNWTKLDFQTPYVNRQSGVNTPISEAPMLTVGKSYAQDFLAFYWRNVIHPEATRFTYLPGVRLDYYNLTKEVLPEPRLAARYALDHGLTLRGATGLYYEAPPVQDMDASFGNPGLKSANAIHYSMGFEKDFRGGDSSGWVWSTDLIYKQLRSVVQNTSSLNDAGQPIYYDNGGRGRIYGAEFMVKYQSKKWNGWLAYTLSRSLRTYPPLAEQLYQYDQTHNLIVVADRELGHNWKFSGRLRFTSGDPYTPIVSSEYDVDNDTYVPRSGTVYSQRMPAFFEVDLRFDKKFVYNTWILTAYVDVENATNHKNVEQINYSYDYSQHSSITGLPVLPTFGVKGEF